MNRIFFLLLIIMILPAAVCPQNSRLLSLGGLTFSVSDPDYSLNPYDFGNNPAWLIIDEKVSYLKITPAFNRTWGGYKRNYDFGSTNVFSTSFHSIRPLGKSGTFSGYASYKYERRNDVYKSLKYNTYAGEAFYTLDTVNGNFKYNGPAVGFSYGYELLTDLFIGASVNYSITDGLRSTYSHSKTLIRQVDGKAGLAWRISGAAALSMSFCLFDSQESLEMKSINESDIVIFNFRGDKYSIMSKREHLNQKIRIKGKGFDGQVYMNPADNIEMTLYGDYNTHGTYILIPQNFLKEFEEGYAEFENYRIKLRAKYSVTDNFKLGGAADYFGNYSWSRNSSRSLLLWEWKLNGPSLGIGASYYFSPYKLLLGAEYEISSVQADSSKYIDTKFVNINSNSDRLRLGLEYEPFTGAFLRAGLNYGNEPYDFVNGGENVLTNGISLGLGYKFPGTAEIDVCLYYRGQSPEHSIGFTRNKLSMTASVRLLSFY